MADCTCEVCGCGKKTPAEKEATVKSEAQIAAATFAARLGEEPLRKATV